MFINYNREESDNKKKKVKTKYCYIASDAVQTFF